MENLSGHCCLVMGDSGGGNISVSASLGDNDSNTGDESGVRFSVTKGMIFSVTLLDNSAISLKLQKR